jgi:hypothetical protein
VLRRVIALHTAVVFLLFQAEDWIRADLWRPLRIVVIIGVPLAIAALYGVAIRSAGAARGVEQIGYDAPTGRPSTI